MLVCVLLDTAFGFAPGSFLLQDGFDGGPASALARDRCDLNVSSQPARLGLAVEYEMVDMPCNAPRSRSREQWPSSRSFMQYG